ncbi:MAG: hypothetical protein ACI4EH_02250, partial [Oliverpabstia sp.]
IFGLAFPNASENHRDSPALSIRNKMCLVGAYVYFVLLLQNSQGKYPDCLLLSSIPDQKSVFLFFYPTGVGCFPLF